MSKVIVKGVKEDGTLDTEVKLTSVLITELIGRIPKHKMCEADLVNALKEIRGSAEMDHDHKIMYLRILKDEKNTLEDLEKKCFNASVKKIGMSKRAKEAGDDHAFLDGQAHAFMTAAAWIQKKRKGEDDEEDEKAEPEANVGTEPEPQPEPTPEPEPEERHHVPMHLIDADALEQHLERRFDGQLFGRIKAVLDAQDVVATIEVGEEE